MTTETTARQEGLGSTLAGPAIRTCSFEEASTQLGRSVRQLHTYVSQGLLRKTLRGKRSVLLLEDVETMAEELGSTTPAVNRRSVLDLTRRVKQLETEIFLLRRRLGVGDRILPVPADEGKKLYHYAKASLSRRPWGLEELDAWMEVLPRLDENLFSVVQETVGGRPWAPFFEVVTSAVEQLKSDLDIGRSLRLQALLADFEAQRARLRETIVMWGETNKLATPLDYSSVFENYRTALRTRLAASKHADS
jgi:hypothetical protein